MNSTWDRSDVEGYDLYNRSFRDESPASRGLLMSHVVHIGASYMRFEPPDTCLIAYVGELEGDDVAQMNASIELVARSVGYVYMLVDLSRTGDVSPDAR